MDKRNMPDYLLRLIMDYIEELWRTVSAVRSDLPDAVLRV